MERFGVQGIQLLLQIILARLLSPEHYSVLAVMLIFTSLASVFVQHSFGAALIQNKDVTEEDYSSVLWVTLMIAAVCYGGLYLLAPLIAVFYEMPLLVEHLRVLGLTLFPLAFNSVQMAKAGRAMDFRKVFFSSICGLLISGTVGILVAYMGGGLWALVMQNLVNVTVSGVIMSVVIHWRPRLLCNWQRIKVLFSYGWKLMTSLLIVTLYDNIYSIVIGKKYSGETLGYYDRGTLFPRSIVNSINLTTESVMLSAMSKIQDDREAVKMMMRRSMMMGAYLVFPVMVGLAAVAEPLIVVLLTEKWLPCVPYMRLFCIACAFDPVHTCNLQAINAIGRSDVYLKLEIAKKVCFAVLLMGVTYYFDSPIAIAAIGIVNALLCWTINIVPNQKLMCYTFAEQIKDLLPPVFMTACMGTVVAAVGKLNLAPLATLALQIPVGVAVYLLLSVLFRPYPYRMAMETVMGFLKK